MNKRSEIGNKSRNQKSIWLKMYSWKKKYGLKLKMFITNNCSDQYLCLWFLDNRNFIPDDWKAWNIESYILILIFLPLFSYIYNLSYFYLHLVYLQIPIMSKSVNWFIKQVNWLTSFRVDYSTFLFSKAANEKCSFILIPMVDSFCVRLQFVSL